MLILFAYVGLLNILDGWLTYVGLEKGLIEESNPLMFSLYQASPQLFWGFKLLLGLSAVAIGVYFKPHRHIAAWKFVLVFCCLLYTSIMFIHANWILNEM